LVLIIKSKILGKNTHFSDSFSWECALAWSIFVDYIKSTTTTTTFKKYTKILFTLLLKV